jgi:predicted RNA-binding protein with PUA-like domain
MVAPDQGCAGADWPGMHPQPIVIGPPAKGIHPVKVPRDLARSPRPHVRPDPHRRAADVNLCGSCRATTISCGMPTLLLKTEPGEYSFDGLVRDTKTAWTGVSNPGALINLRSARKGDEVFIYHTGDERSIVGLAKVVSDPYEDPKRKGLAPDGRPKFAVIDLAPVRKGKTSLRLAEMKADKRFAAFALLKQSRLSVVPVPAAIEKIIRSLCSL